MRKKILASLLALCMALAMLPATALAAFDDTAGHWSESSVERWADAGILSGDGSGSFLPNKEMTRAEFAQMLCNLMGYTEKAPNTFADIPDDAWYADAVLKLNAAGVMSGVGGNMAAPNAPITREQAAVLLCRAMNIKPSQNADVSFSDAGSVSGWAKDAVAALTERGMINGVGGNTFAPGLNINRASVAKMVDNMVSDYVTENGATITGEVKGVVIIKADNVKIENATLSEPLVVAPAAANATVSLTGTTAAADVVVAAQGAKVTVAETATAATVSVDAPKAEAQVAGKVDTVAVTEKAEGAKATVAETAEVKTVTVEAPKAETQVAGKVDTVAVAETAEGAKATVDKGAEVKDMTVAAPNTETQVAGKVDNVAVAETAKDVTVNTSSSAQVGNVTTEAEGTKVSGSGKVDSVTATGSADNTSVTTPGTKTENKTEGGSMTDGKGNETKPGESGTSSGSSGGSSGGSSSGGGGGGGGSSTTTTYTVTFNSNGGSAVAAATVTSGGKVTRPTDPTKAGYTFSGWYTDEEFANAYDFNANVTANITLYAKWTEGAHEHTWGDWAVTTPATCAAEGKQTRTCSKCGATEEQAITKLAHTEVTVPAVAPTCAAEGKTEGKKCSVCGEVIQAQKTVEKVAHTYTKGTVIMADATNHKKVCDVCGDSSVTEAHSIDTNTHECACGYQEPVVDDGVTACTDGNHTWVEDTSAAGKKDATCTETGTKVYKCSKTVSISDEENVSQTKEVNCTATKTETVAALGHHLVADPASDKAATCTEAGAKDSKKCDRTDCTFKVAGTVIPATGHTFAAEWSKDNTHHWHAATCGHTNEKSGNAEHTWNDGVETKPATCTDAGVKTFTCTVCGQTKTEAIKATGHTEVTDAAVEATCTTAGKTAGKHCSVCDTVTEAQKEVKALGHSYEAEDSTEKPKDNGDGTHTYTCTRAACTDTTKDHTKIENHNFDTTDGICVCGAMKVYNITINTTNFPAGCKVEADKDTSANANDNVVLTVTIAEGYKLGEDGLKVTYTVGSTEVNVKPITGEEGKYSFTMPGGDVTVTAEFEKMYNIGVATTNESDSITFKVGDNQNATKAAEGDTVTINIEAGSRQIKEVAYTSGENTVQTVVTLTENTYTFTMPAADVTVTVTFEETTQQPTETI